jgi:hypothetical protein
MSKYKDDEYKYYVKRMDDFERASIVNTVLRDSVMSISAIVILVLSAVKMPGWGMLINQFLFCVSLIFSAAVLSMKILSFECGELNTKILGRELSQNYIDGKRIDNLEPSNKARKLMRTTDKASLVFSMLSIIAIASAFVF